MTQEEFENLKPGDVVIVNQPSDEFYTKDKEYIVRKTERNTVYTILDDSYGWYYKYFDLPTITKIPFKKRERYV